MKVPPKRKGKSRLVDRRAQSSSLNESPSEKEGKEDIKGLFRRFWESLNESPSEKEGKWQLLSSLPWPH